MNTDTTTLDVVTDSVAFKIITPILIGQGIVVTVVILATIVIVLVVKRMLQSWLSKVEKLLWMQEQHYIKNQEQKVATLRSIQQVLERQEEAKQTTEEVKKKVEQVPEVTATKVVEKMDSHGSQDGTTIKIAEQSP